MAVHTNDVALLLSSSQLLRFCENLIFEDNFNNTFALHRGGASAKVEKVFQIFANDKPTNIHGMFKNIFAGTKSKIPVLGIVTTKIS